MLTDQRRPSFRHRLEYAAVCAVVGRRPPAADARRARRRARCSGARSISFDGAHRRLAMRQPAGGVSRRAPTAECRAIARRMFAHFGRLLTVLLKFSTMTPGADAARASSSKARIACVARARAAARRAAVHRALRVLGNQRAGARADAPADGGAGAAARQSAAARPARAVRTVDRQLASSTGAARSAASCARSTRTRPSRC